MTPDQLRALADALRWVQYTADWQACDQAADYLRAQADAQPVAVPAGWKWVPVEPTPEMLSAVGMMDGYDWHAPGCSPDADHANWYSAMLAAAPAAPPAEPADRCRSSETPDPKATGRSSPERPASNREDAAAMVAAGSGEQAEPKREPLTYEQLVSACYTYRHDFGLLDPDEQHLVIEEAGRWAKAFGIGGSDAE